MCCWKNFSGKRRRINYFHLKWKYFLFYFFSQQKFSASNIPYTWSWGFWNGIWGKDKRILWRSTLCNLFLVIILILEVCKGTFSLGMHVMRPCCWLPAPPCLIFNGPPIILLLLVHKTAIPFLLYYYCCPSFCLYVSSVLLLKTHLVTLTILPAI